jgi:hypothetical protein
MAELSPEETWARIQSDERAILPVKTKTGRDLRLHVDINELCEGGVRVCVNESYIGFFLVVDAADLEVDR